MSDEPTDEATVRCWLVDRSFDDRNLVTVVYATPDGRRVHRSEKSANAVRRSPVTAASDLRESALEPVEDDELRERYAEEASRMADRHGPDETL